MESAQTASVKMRVISGVGLLISGLLIGAGNAIIIGLAMAGEIFGILGILNFVLALIAIALTAIAISAYAWRSLAAGMIMIFIVTIVSMVIAGSAAQGNTGLPMLRELTGLYYTGITMATLLFTLSIHKSLSS